MASKNKDNKKNKKQGTKKVVFLKRIANWFGDIKSELYRVNWTDRKKLKLNTGTVLIIVVTIALMIFVFDFTISTILSNTGFYTARKQVTTATKTNVTEIQATTTTPVNTDAAAVTVSPTTTDKK